MLTWSKRCQDNLDARAVCVERRTYGSYGGKEEKFLPIRIKQMVLALTKITERKGLVDVIFFNNLYLKLPMIILIIIGISYP